MFHQTYMSIIIAQLRMVMKMMMWSVTSIEILDTFGMMITNSPGEGVLSGQGDPTVGVGSQALPIPMKDCGSECGESGGLVGSRQVHSKT